jgi:hypothetical protein
VAAAESELTHTLSEISRAAALRSAESGEPFAFDPAERQRLADALAAVLAASELSGRARIRQEVGP